MKSRRELTLNYQFRHELTHDGFSFICYERAHSRNIYRGIILSAKFSPFLFENKFITLTNMGLRFKVDGLNCMYFITTTVVNHLPILCIKNVPEILFLNLNYYRNKYNFLLHAYVIMPSHIHLIIWVPENVSVSDIMRDFKKYTSLQTRDLLIKTNSKYLQILFNEGKKYPGQKFKLWKQRSDKVSIVSEKILFVKINYIHDNPVRAGLVDKPELYPYSSARNYLLDEEGPIRIDRIEI